VYVRRGRENIWKTLKYMFEKCVYVHQTQNCSKFQRSNKVKQQQKVGRGRERVKEQAKPRNDKVQSRLAVKIMNLRSFVFWVDFFG